MSYHALPQGEGTEANRPDDAPVQPHGRRVLLVWCTVGVILCAGACEVAGVLHSETRRAGVPPLTTSGSQALPSRTVLEGQNLAKASKELQDVMKENEEAMAKKARTIRKEMHSLSVTPWATLHPGRVDRIESRDRALIKQAKKQEHDDKKLLGSMHKEETSMKKKALSSSGAGDYTAHTAQEKHSEAIARLLGKASLAAKQQQQGKPADAQALFHEKKRHLKATRSKVVDRELDSDVVDKAGAQQRLAQKAKIAAYRDDADSKKHHTVETLPYILPPVGLIVLVTLGFASSAVKKSQGIPSSVSGARRQNIDEIKGALGGGGVAAEASWQEMEGFNT
jgi:hypothetical protein